MRRRLISVGSGIAQDAAGSEKETAAILDDAERRIYDIAMRKTADTMEPISSVYSRVYTQIGEYMQNRGRRTGIATGLIDLDELTSGLQRSDLIIIAGRPRNGQIRIRSQYRRPCSQYAKAQPLRYSALK